jgi:hypothetical protein
MAGYCSTGQSPQRAVVLWKNKNKKVQGGARMVDKEMRLDGVLLSGAARDCSSVELL